MNIKKLFALSIAFCLAANAFCQSDKKDTAKADTVKAWDVGGILNVAFSQASFTNWAAGGQNSIGLISMASVHANFKKNKISWANSIDMAYGFQKLDKETAQKSTDKIEATSSLGFTIAKNTTGGLLVNFKSQFATGYEFPANDSVLLSKFMAPGYLTIAPGVTWTPATGLTLFISPATLKYTFVEDQGLADAGAYGVNPAIYDSTGKKIQDGKTYLVQAGAYFKGDYTATVTKGITINTDLQLFSNYLKDPQDIVVDWTTLIQLKVNKFISVTINTELIYDNNILIPIYSNENGVNVLVGKGPRTQFKDVTGVGFAYNF